METDQQRTARIRVNSRRPGMRCPHCGKTILSPRALQSLERARRDAATRGGYMWEGARPAYEAGEYKDPELDELLAAGAIEPHPDPAKGWVVTGGRNA